MNYLFGALLFFSLNAHSQQCTPPIQLSKPANKMHKIFVGTKCNSLDRNTWDESWKTPCDCLHQQDLSSKIGRRFHKKEDLKKLNNIDLKVEKKIAAVFKTQIFSQLEQSLRLDIYLKKGIVSTRSIGKDKENSISFPLSCRIDKIKELISSLSLPSSGCNNPRKNERLKLLFGEGGDPSKSQFDNWKDSQMKLFESTVMNKLSDEDKKEGMCVPYKTFLSLNTTNNLRMTYLKVAKAKKGSFKDFQLWASDRYAPDDTANIIGNTLANEQFNNTSTGSALDFLKPGFGASSMSKQIETLKLKLDDKSEIEPISKEDIQHLIKTDPIFERMVRDPQFFKAMTEQDLNTFNPNDPKIIKLISESQNTQCKQLYGEVGNVDKSDIDGKQGKDKKSSKKKENAEISKEKNLLTKFLCEEDFPRDFIDEGVIESNLAPEFKNELGLKTEQESTDLLVDYLYCQDKETKKRNIASTNEGVSADFTSTFQGIPKNDDIKNLLNLSLNPKSDLESQDKGTQKKSNLKDQNNEYKKFNLATCPFVDEKCKGESPDGTLNPKCSMAALSTSVAMEIMKLGFPKSEQTAIGKQIFDPAISDKELRNILSDPKSFLNKEQIDSIIIIRHQNTKFLWQEVAADLRKETKGKLPPEGGNPMLYFFSHTEEIKNNPNISQELKNRIYLSGKVRDQNSVASEKTTDESSSFFANYFILGDATNESNIALSGSSSPMASRPIASNNNPNSGTSPVSTGSVNIPNPSLSGGNSFPSSGNSNAGSPIPSAVSIPVEPVENPIYQRKSFATPKSPEIQKPGLVIEEKKPIVPEVKKDTTENKPIVTEKPVKEKVPLVSNTNLDTIPKINNTQGLGLQLSQSGNSNLRDSTANNNPETDALEKTKRDLEDKLKRKLQEYEDLKNGSDNSENSNGELSEREKLKKRLTDELNELRNQNRNSKPSSNRNVNQNLGNTNNNWNNKENDTSWNNKDNGNSPFNNGYGRGEEFDTEKAKKKLDDGSAEFDPENTSKERAPASTGGGSAGGSGKGKGGSAVLSSSMGGSDSEGGSAGPNSRKNRRKGFEGSESDVIAKCGTGPILKCIFPNSYFVDDKIKGRLYTVIANLKLEGRKFQGLEKVRRSKKEMKMGESNKAKYFLYTYDLILDGKNREVTNEERDDIFKEIKENRKDPAFKKKLTEYRFMTKIVPPKILLNEKEAFEAVNRSITKEEYEALQD